MTNGMIDSALIAECNQVHQTSLEEDYQALGRQLARRGVNIEEVTEAARRFSVALPSWGVGTGGTRFARFPGSGEPRHIFDKVEDCSVINQLCRCTPRVSPHFPWDTVDDFTELRDFATHLGLGWDSVNSNTFQDQPGQRLSYKYGSLTHTDKAVREQAIEHNVQCIEWGRLLGSTRITVWIGDGANHPGQQHFQRAFERYLDSGKQIHAALPHDWEMHIEHKLFEPAFYATVIQDWGSSLLAATEIGTKAHCLVDLGHHAPNVNIEMIVSRLIQFGRLGGFHFNDSKYGDDDLDSGAIQPYQLFLIFNELVDASHRKQPDFAPAYLLDQSHNVTDPIESLINSAVEVQRAYVKALLVDRQALDHFQDTNDALMASNTLKAAFNLDVSPILATARLRNGGAIDPIATYRQSGYRQSLAAKRPAAGGSRSGIV